MNASAIELDSAGTVVTDSATTTAFTSGTTMTLSSGGVLAMDTVGTSAINLGTQAAAKTITVGNTTGATGINLKSGTGYVTLSNTTDATSSTAAGTIVSGGLAVAKKINVGTDVTVGGTVQATNVIAISDGTLKTNITDLNDPLATINKLHGVQYDWKDPNNDDHEIGLIAQDVEEVVPEVVRRLGNSDFKGIEYQKLTALLIEAVKELSNEIDLLKSKA